MKTIINAANIHSVEWVNETLSLYFNDGSVIEYLKVPEGIYAGICTAQSVGSYLRLYVYGRYSYRKIKESDLEHRVKELEHHKATTVGLWATDRPDLIPESIRDMFFEITE